MNKKITSLLALVQNRGLLALGCLVFGISASAQTTYYVKPVATGTGDGTSWENASGDLQLTINNAVATDQIWVAAGTYLPNRKANDLATITPANRDNAFVLKEGIKIYGGFAGTEALFNDRDLTIVANESILSGDFNNDDVVTGTGATLAITNTTDNAYHVVLSVGSAENRITGAAIVDGFTIKGGIAHDAAFTNLIVNAVNIARYSGGGIANYNYASPTFSNIYLTANSGTYGGGIYNKTNSSPFIKTVTIIKNIGETGGGITNWDNASPTLEYAIITENIATAGGGIYNYNNSSPSILGGEISLNIARTGSGGGIYNYNSSPSINAGTITGNTAATFGGGMNNISNSAPVIVTLTIENNSATDGGGMYNSESSPYLTDVHFINNQATTGRGGGLYNIDGSSPLIYSNTFSKNGAFTYGGGIINWTNSSPVIRNTTFTENTAQIGAGILNNDGSSPVITNVYIQKNTAVENGGGMANYTNSSPILTNVLITNNTSNNGGGMFNIEASSPILTNVTITNNAGGATGGGISNNGSNPELRNSILYGNTSTESRNINNYNGSMTKYAYSLVEGSAEGWGKLGIDGGNNIDGDPLFANVPLLNYAMRLDSPTINAGSNAFYAADKTPNLVAITTDLAGNDRFYEDGTIDMGAFENQGVLNTPAFTKKSITLYPNPVANEFTIQSDYFISDVVVYNMLGQVVLQQNLNANQGKVNVAGLQNANYVVKVIADNKVTSLLISKQ